VELLQTEGVELHFDDEVIREIARMAALLNKTAENIGAQRLHTVKSLFLNGTTKEIFLQFLGIT